MERAEIYARAREHGALIDLSRRAKWRLTGADRVRFLNGQTSNDMRKLDGPSTLRACVMTAKGKMSGDVFVCAETDFLQMDAEPSLREELAARLGRYIIADDVLLEDVTEENGLLHVLTGPAKLEPDALPDVLQKSATRFGQPGCDLHGTRAACAGVWRRLGEIFTPLDDELAEVFRIEAGVPRWGAELDENTIPVEAGLDATAIDYHKGCYIGQEVISRLKSVGHVNRTLRGFVSAAPLAAGMEFFAPGAEKPAGRLTSAAWSFGLEKFAALGYLRRGVDATTLEARASSGDACEVEVRALPLIP